MTALLAWLTARNKALTAAAVGLYGWGLFVVDSSSRPITAHEWMLLASVGLGVIGVHQVPNIAAPTTVTLKPTVFETSVSAGKGQTPAVAAVAPPAAPASVSEVQPAQSDMAG